MKFWGKTRIVNYINCYRDCEGNWLVTTNYFVKKQFIFICQSHFITLNIMDCIMF